MNSLLMLGIDDAHLSLCSKEPRVFLHEKVIKPLSDLQGQASENGFDLQVASGWRGFERQLSIWNRKAIGELVVLDLDERPLDIKKLSSEELVLAILRWSALPGASRHHWGTDMDVYDRAALPENHRLQLTQQESSQLFAGFHQWLDGEIEGLGFYRPYAEDKGGVSPEPWHLSYRPLAREFEGEMSVNILREQLEKTDIALKETLLLMLDEIWQRFVVV